MADFLEEQISDLILQGSSWQDDYKVDITETSSGQEDRFLLHAFPRRTFDVSYMMSRQDLYDKLVALYHRAHGKYSGFRVRCYDEWSSNGATGTPTRVDQPLTLISGYTYQIRKYYGLGKAAGAAGYPYRTIFKPVAGTVIVGVSGKKVSSADFSVSTTTGVVTFSSVVGNISGISNAVNASINYTRSGDFAIGDSFYISGVSGMTQINGLRATVISTFSGGCTVDINTSAFSSYASGGIVYAYPGPNETPTCGFEFDFPARFDTVIPAGQDFPDLRSVEGVRLIELLNP